MKIEDTRKAYKAYSEKASNIVRQLAFAGIALTWLFKYTSESSAIAIPSELFSSAAWIAITLVLDLLHYVVGSVVWSFYGRKKETQLSDRESTFTAPIWINWPTIAMFYGKLISILVAYSIIIPYLYENIGS